MIYKVNDFKIKQNLLNELSLLNYPYEVRVFDEPKTRTLPQNKLYWKILEIISDHTGETKDYLHGMFGLMFLPKDEYVINGERYLLPVTTTRLSTKEFSEYIEQIRMEVSELGLILPYPDDFGF